MSVTISVSDVFEHSIGAVFRFHAVDHVTNHPRWDPHIRLKKLTEGPLRVGSRVHRINTRSGVPVEGSMEVTEIEENRVFEMKIEDGTIRMLGRAEYEAVGPGQTRVKVSVVFPDLDELPNREMLSAAMQQSLTNIKGLLDEG